MPTNETQPDTGERDLHRDPITGAPGAHPVGTGVGAAAAGAAGAAIGAVGGPIGMAVGAAIGAVAGGLIGKGVAEAIDPTAEDAYWREHHGAQPYTATEPYEIYAAAYRVGYTGFRDGRTFEEREADLRMEYEGDRQRSEAEYGEEAKRATSPETMPGTMQNNMSTYPLRWDAAREAARAAYERVRRGEAHSADRRPEGGPAVD